MRLLRCPEHLQLGKVNYINLRKNLKGVVTKIILKNYWFWSATGFWNESMTRVVGEVFKRCRLVKYATLFEENWSFYEVRFEVGRDLIEPDLVNREEHFKHLEQYQENYGADIVREFLRRLGKHDLLPA